MTKLSLPVVRRRVEWFHQNLETLAKTGRNLREAGIPRVSDLLRPISDLSHIPSDILRNAAKRGTEVHEWIEGEIAFRSAGFENPSIPKSGRYAYSWKKCADEIELWDDSKPNYEKWATEIPIGVDNRLAYRGTADLIRYSPYSNSLQVVDWKTSAKPYATHAVQITLYRIAVEEVFARNPPPETGGKGLVRLPPVAVYVKKDGSAPEIVEPAPSTWNVAQGLIRIHHFRYEHDIRYRNQLLAQHHKELK